jgi:DNA-binding MarR family transcriptional regulator
MNCIFRLRVAVSFIQSHALRRAFLANLLEQLAAQIVSQGEALLEDAGVIVPARAVSTLLLLGERGEMSAADLARVLRQPHQLVTQRVELLIGLGVVARVADARDARRKALRLTAKGRRQRALLNRALTRADAAFAALFDEIGCDLAAKAVDAMAALDRSPLLGRARAAGASASD